MTLEELQAKRRQMAADLKKQIDKRDPQKGWLNAEDKQNYDLAAKAYDEFKANEFDPVATAEVERTEIANRLAELEGIENLSIGGSPRNRIGRDGAELGNGPANRGFFANQNGLNRGADFLRNQAIALQGWMLSGRQSEDVTEEHHLAARAVGARLGSNDFQLQFGNTNGLSPTDSFRRTQAPFLAGCRSRGGDISNWVGEIRNDLAGGQPSKGGVTVGQTLLPQLELALLAYLGTLQVADIRVTGTGEPFRWPTANDTTNKGARVGENQDAGYATPVDPAFGRLTLQAFTYHSNFIDISRALMQDSVIDLESTLGELMGIRIGRKQNDDFTTGADVGNGPLGIVTAATSGLTTASNSAIAPDEIITLVHAVDPAYRVPAPGTGFMFNDAILQVIRQLKDGMGRYLWSEGTTNSEPDRLHGFPYWINQSMDSTVSSGKKTMLFGALRKYKVRMVNGIRIQRLVERKAEFDEDCFIAYLRADGGLLDAGTHPVKYMTH